MLTDFLYCAVKLMKWVLIGMLFLIALLIVALLILGVAALIILF